MNLTILTDPWPVRCHGRRRDRRGEPQRCDVAWREPKHCDVQGLYEFTMILPGGII